MSDHCLPYITGTLLKTTNLLSHASKLTILHSLEMHLC